MFTHTLSKILYDKGLESQTDRFYIKLNDEWVLYTTDEAKASFNLSKYNFHLAFNFLDILNRENAVKLFKKSTCCELCGTLLFGSKCNVHPHEAGYVEQWEYILHKLLDLYLSGGEQAVEKRLVEMLICNK